MKKILVTGGAGYIGSHMVWELIKRGYEPIVVDNFSNSSDRNLTTIEKKTRRKIQTINLDLKGGLNDLNIHCDAIIHFAALKAVGESVLLPLEYYENNVYGSINLLKLARDNGVKKFIFSSTAAVYGNSKIEQVNEETETNPESPYGRSKLMVEEIIKDCNKAFGLNSCILRYFNVAGNEETGAIGDLQAHPQNLIPAMIMSHLKLIDTKMKVFGNDYPTPDGTGVRDYIHVLDLIDAHIKALEFLETNNGSHIFNLGTGTGLSVLQIIKGFEEVTGEKLDYEIVGRRVGDVATITTDATKAKKLLGWEAKLNVNEMIESMWKWYNTWRIVA